jgi:hypothetical protein
MAYAASIRGHAAAALCTARELRRTRRLLSDGGLKAVHGRVRPLPVERGRGLVVRTTLSVLKASCLERSLILQAWHASTGDPRDIVIGVSGPGEPFGAHAWLAGLETPADAGFHELHRVPPPTQSSPTA